MAAATCSGSRGPTRTSGETVTTLWIVRRSCVQTISNIVHSYIIFRSKLVTLQQQRWINNQTRAVMLGKKEGKPGSADLNCERENSY